MSFTRLKWSSRNTVSLTPRIKPGGYPSVSKVLFKEEVDCTILLYTLITRPTYPSGGYVVL